MLPLLTSAEVKALDALCSSRFGLPVELLMESAGRSVAELAGPLCLTGRAVVFAGPGNNGGDGFVAARHLVSAGLDVTVMLTVPEAKVAATARANLERWRQLGGQVASDSPAIGSGDLVLDALLGTGLSRAPEGTLRDAIRSINEARARGAKIVAIDLPSGLDADTGATPGEVVRADLTVTLGAHKRGLWQEPGSSVAGEIRLGSLGLPSAAIAALEVKASLVELSDVRQLLPRRPAAAFKNSFGHLLVVAGSPGKSGAAALAVHGALRAGAGLVTLAARDDVLRAALQGRPEAMSIELEGALEGVGTLSCRDVDPILAALKGKQALAIGPGLSHGDETSAAIAKLLETFEGPVVLDADALNAIAGQRGLLARARGPTVLTPHPGEMARLTGKSSAEIQANRYQAAEAFARAERTTVVLKGAKTVIASPEGRLAVIPTGGPGLAHGGTGDVLCGIIGALLAQGLAPFQAALAGAFVHGLAGDRVVQRVGERGLLAGDVAEELGALWAEIGA